MDSLERFRDIESRKSLQLLCSPHGRDRRNIQCSCLFQGEQRPGDPEGRNILAQIFFKKLAKPQSHSSKLPSLPYSDHIYYY